jgi:hypothetical protein
MHYVVHYAISLKIIAAEGEVLVLECKKKMNIY